MPEQFQMLFTRMLDGFALHEIILDSAGKPSDYRFIAVNPAFEEITGLAADAVVGKTVLEVLPDTEPHWIENYGRVALSGEPFRFESSHAGLGKHFEVVAFRPKNGQFACIFRDITDRKMRESEIEQLTHLYAVLSQVNQAIVRANSREELFRSICQVAVEFGHFRSAWIGSLDPATGEVTLEAQQAGAQVCANECSVIRTAIKEGRPAVFNELAPDQSPAVCHILAAQSNVGACAAFPIRRRGHVAAALCLHADPAGFFNSAEVKLLEEVADDISFALDKLDEETQRRAAEQEIREQRQLLSLILEGTMAGYWDWHIQDGTNYLSPSFKKMFGYLGHELSNTPDAWKSLIFPDDLPGILDVLERHMESHGRIPFYGEARFRHRNGSTVWVIYTGKVVEWDAAGRALRIIGCHIDITKRKVVEENLEREMEFNRAMLDSITDGVVACDADGKLVFFNRTTREWHGVDAAGIPAQEWAGYYDLFGPDDVTPLTAEEIPLQRAFSGEEVHEAAATIRAKGRPLRQVLASGRAIYDPDGRKLGAVVAMHDVTERKRHEAEREAAQAALRETEERLQAIVDQTPSLVYVKNLDGQLTLANHSFESLFGLTRRELLGKTSHDILPREVAEAHHANDLEVIRRCEPVYFEEAASINGVNHTFLSVKFPLTGADGAIYAVCGISTDITERKRAEKEKSSLEDQLRQAQRLESIGRLAGGIAHDFNNLLTVINGYGDLMRGQLNPGDPLRHFLEEILGAGERAAGLTQQLLAFSRKQVIAPKALRLNALISQTRNMLRRLIGEDVELSTVLDPSLGVVMGDEGLLHQVLMNLAVNARDAMPNGGVLTIETANFDVDQAYSATHTEIAPGSYVMLAVSDTGIGIDEAAKEHIFEPFFTTKSEGKGTGLGLSTVYGIVRQFGGWIWVYSEPGHGATFKIYLPRIEDSAANRDLKQPAIGSLRGFETVLIVEDQDDVRRLAASVLQSYGYRVLQAEQGGEALLLAERHPGPIQLMVTDVVMPRMTGRELAERLAPLRPEMRVLYMSGYTENAIVHQGVLDAGIEFIPKPFTPGALAAKVREILGPPRSPGSILVVDENGGVRSLFQQILSGAGYIVATAAGTKEAMSALSDGAFDIVLTDFVLPESDGVDLVRAVRKEHPRLKVIGASGSFGIRPLDKALDLDATLAKPVSPAALLEVVRRLLA